MAEKSGGLCKDNIMLEVSINDFQELQRKQRASTITV